MAEDKIPDEMKKEMISILEEIVASCSKLLELLKR